MIIKTSPDEIQNYLVDAANVKGFCAAVYFPETEEEIVQIVKEANEKKTHITVAGNGTGLTGARVPEGGIVISTEKLNKIIKINVEEKTAVVQPAVILKEFQEEVESKNLFYPPDPTERNCFIGATVATNASGAKTFKYGPTRDYVLELRIVLPNGELIRLERGKNIANEYLLELKCGSGKIIKLEIPNYKMPETKHAAGYFCNKNMDAIDLFIGSEGTLGIITEIKLKLLDLPQNIISAVIFFKNENDALNFLTEARKLSYQTRNDKLENEIDARGLEFFDHYTLKFLIEQYPQIPKEAQAAVWFEQEFTPENEEAIFGLWMELITEFNGDEETAWIASNKNDIEKFKDFRHAVSWKVSDYISRKNITKVGTDIAVPDEKFIEFYKWIRREVEKTDLDFVIYGHFGDSHIHLNMLPKDQKEHHLAKTFYTLICEKAICLHGTVSAEHGIGKLKRGYLLKMFGEENIKQMAKLKLSLDPNKILGIGNIFEERYLTTTEHG
ncbi:MAG: FAD-binding oxidoreductase [Ignavibacteriales bacterium]|nr:FAD-binding oxidoreductase [Ignavibacteriales bacterium]